MDARSGACVRDLPPAIKSAGITLSHLLLTTQVLPQLTAAGIVSVDILVDRLVDHKQLASDLYRAPMQF